MVTIAALLSCIVSIVIRRMEGSWFAPAALFSLLWSLVIVFSVISAPDYYFSVDALLFVIFNLILFFTGGKIYDYYIRNKEIKSTRNALILKEGNYKVFILAGVLSGCLAVCLLIIDSGSDFYILFDFKKLMNLSSALTESRYYGVRLSAPIMLCLTISYFSSFFAGMNLAVKPGNASRNMLILLLLPVVVFTLIYTARAVLLFMIFNIIASYIAFRPLNKLSKPILFNRFNILAVLTGVSLLFLVFFFAQAARMQVENFGIHQIEMLVGHLRVWFSGNVSAFSIWVDTRNLHVVENSGSNTFAGLYELLGITTRKLGIYSSAVDVNSQMEFSNIYTLFRFLMDDFGAFGTCLIFFVSGIVARKFYSDGLKHQNLISGAILAGLIVVFLWSFITSVFAYNSVLFSWIGFVIVIKFNQRYAI